jgi:hypothetical protein
MGFWSSLLCIELAQPGRAGTKQERKVSRLARLPVSPLTSYPTNYTCLGSFF